MQEAIFRDEKSVVLTWLKREDLLADGICVQTTFAPQSIQKFEVGKVEREFGSVIGCENALRRES